jgi:glutamate racemase
MTNKAIGVFDSGYGGLTILSELQLKMPQYDFLYLGDNARTPYGTRSFDVVYDFTLQAVEFLFAQGCELVILACNTASAKALRSIQQQILPQKYPDKRVLGVIRPTSEIIGNYSKTKNIGLFATEGTVKSQSYLIEIEKFFHDIHLEQHACPIWVPLIENSLHETAGGKWFIHNDLDLLLTKNQKIDTILLACTHYPLVKSIIEEKLPKHISLISQGQIVAESLVDYLARHPEMDQKISKTSKIEFLTTENHLDFDQKAAQFFEQKIISKTVKLN